MMRTYSDLLVFKTYQERFNYLSLNGTIGEQTFGGLRHLNQQFYRSREWRFVRDHVIVRDNGCDLGFPDNPIVGDIFVHHMNPLDPNILVHCSHLAVDPEYLITVSFDTHQAIHYGRNLRDIITVERYPGDTKLW